MDQAIKNVIDAPIQKNENTSDDSDATTNEKDKKYPKATLIECPIKFPNNMDIPVYCQLLPKNTYGICIVGKYEQRGIQGPAIILARSTYKDLIDGKPKAYATLLHEFGHYWHETFYDCQSIMNLTEKNLIKRFINYTMGEKKINQHAVMLIQLFYSQEPWAEKTIEKLEKIIKSPHYAYPFIDNENKEEKVIIVHKTIEGYEGEELTKKQYQNRCNKILEEIEINKMMSNLNEDDYEG